MKARLLLTALCLIAAPASHVWAQTAAPKAAAPENVRPTITVVGQVNKPGKLPFVAGENLSALVERAGGATAVAAMKQLYILRDGVAIPLDLSRTQAENFVLRTGDILSVPQNQRRIFVLGNVARPGNYLMKEKDSTFVWEALTLAGGPSANSINFRIGIVRSKPEPSVEWHAWPKDMDDPLFQIPLQDGEGVFVERVTPPDSPPAGGLQLLENK